MKTTEVEHQTIYNMPERQAVANAIVGARTKEQVLIARRMLDEWLTAHPNDIGILEASTGLERIAHALGMPSPLMD